MRPHLVLLLLGLGVMARPVTAQQSTSPSACQGARGAADVTCTDEDGQRPALPPRPTGLTVAMIVQGDGIYHGKGGCASCHGADGTGMPARGSALTVGLNYIPKPYSLRGIDSLLTSGIAEPITRTPVACPPRGLQSDLTPVQVRRVAAYVWAISQARGEPWAGGHRTHRDAASR